MNELEEYINRVLHNINEEYYELQRKQGTKDAVTNALCIATTGVGLIFIFGGNIGLGLGLISLGAGVAGYKVKSAKKFTNTITRLEQEKRHIRRESNKEKADDKVIDLRKNKKRHALGICHIYADRRYDYANELTTFSYGLITFGAFATAINPVSVWVPIVGIGVGVLATINEVIRHKEKEVLENRANNLAYDMVIDNILRDGEEKTVVKTEVLDLEKLKKEKAKREELNKRKESNITFDTIHEERPKQYYKSREGK